MTPVHHDRLIEEIRRNLNRILAPSADRFRWDSELCRAFPRHSIVNNTDFNYGKCHSYEIMLPAGRCTPAGSKSEEQALKQSLALDGRVLQVASQDPHFGARTGPRRREPGPDHDVRSRGRPLRPQSTADFENGLHGITDAASRRPSHRSPTVGSFPNRVEARHQTAGRSHEPPL